VEKITVACVGRLGLTGVNARKSGDDEPQGEAECNEKAGSTPKRDILCPGICIPGKAKLNKYSSSGRDAVTQTKEAQGINTSPGQLIPRKSEASESWTHSIVNTRHAVKCAPTGRQQPDKPWEHSPGKNIDTMTSTVKKKITPKWMHCRLQYAPPQSIPHHHPQLAGQQPSPGGAKPGGKAANTGGKKKGCAPSEPRQC